MRALVIACLLAAAAPLLWRRPQAPPEPAVDSGGRVVRRILTPARGVHPAAECYRAAGWQLRPLPLQISDGHRWGCFEARRGAALLEVCQTFVDGRGRSWSDAGSWWWAAQFGRTDGPWTEIVSASPSRRPH